MFLLVNSKKSLFVLLLGNEFDAVKSSETTLSPFKIRSARLLGIYQFTTAIRSYTRGCVAALRNVEFDEFTFTGKR
jgi:hypothetical protein